MTTPGSGGSGGSGGTGSGGTGSGGTGSGGTGSGGTGSGGNTGSGGSTTSPGTGARNSGLAAGGAAAGGAAISALTGGSALGAAESMMQIAVATASAAVILPPSIMVAFQFKLSSGKPANLEKAAADWSAAAAELQQAAQDLRNLAQGIPQQAWNMDDRTAYESKVSDYCLQLDALHNYLMAVSIALTVLAWAMFTYAIFAVGMAVYLGALAVVAVAALASVVGSVSYPALVGLASTGLTITTVATGILASAGVMAGGAMFGGAAITADYQGDHGNAGAGDAFGEAFKNGSAGAAANLVQSGANAGLSFLNRNPTGRGFPLGEVDLDADRDITETWTYGAGAKVNSPLGETEVAGNIKHNDEGWAGGEFGVNHKYEDPSGTVNGTVGGKVTWDENENVGGGFKVGGGHTPSGSGGEYEGNWSHEGDYSDKYKVNTPVYSNEGSWAEGPKDETPPWDK